MPDITGALTQADRAFMDNWFKAYWKGPVTCAICRHTEWRVGDHVLQMPRFAPDFLTGGTVTYPMLPIHCTNCSNTLLLSASAIGLMQADPQAYYKPATPAPPLNPAPAPPLPALAPNNIFKLGKGEG